MFLKNFSSLINNCVAEEDDGEEGYTLTEIQELSFKGYTGDKLMEDGLPKELANEVLFIDAVGKHIVRTQTKQEADLVLAAQEAAAAAAQAPMAANWQGEDSGGDDSNDEEESVKDEPQEIEVSEALAEQKDYKDSEKARTFASLNYAALAALVREKVGAKAASRLEGRKSMAPCSLSSLGKIFGSWVFRWARGRNCSVSCGSSRSPSSRAVRLPFSRTMTSVI
mmetsp:Transcript_11473/g.46405  ORF Transcript_11473/g.46405 Transcript_11473/m.46405 type:complete len:224 (+) Transcript_11473:265-936(+)